MKKNDLYDKFLTDSLNENEEQALLEILEDEQKANSFTEYIIETNMMVSAAENINSASTQIENSRSEIRSVIFIAAAMIVLGFILFFSSSKESFTVSASNVAALPEGTEFINKKIYLESGEVTLKSSNGDLLKLKAPLELSLDSLKQITLNRGLISVTLADKTQNFEVLTPHGVVKDLGTAFALSVKESMAELHVNDGKVQVSLPNIAKTLTQGEAVSFNPASKIKEIIYRENFFEMNSTGTLFMGERELRPGEQMDLVLDSSGQALKADLRLHFKEETNFKYRIIAYSKEEEVFKSKEFSAGEKPSIEIPTSGIEDLKIEMKVLKGYASNSVLKIENLSLLTKGVRPYEGETLISAGSEWQYIFESKPEQNWFESNFDASKWHRGSAVLGFGDKDISTKIGPDELKKTVTRIYFRREFNINDIEINSLKKMVANLLVDDGALIYLNGREILRFNLPEGPINDETHALKVISKSGEMIYQNFSVPADSLKMGKNIISVILLQRKGRSSDMRFDMQLKVF